MTAEVQSLYTAVSAHRSTQQGRSADREDVVQLTHELHKKYAGHVLQCLAGKWECRIVIVAVATALHKSLILII